MKIIKSLLISILIITIFLQNTYAISGKYESFAYGDSEKVVFLWSEYDSNHIYNNFLYYKIIRTDLKKNKSTIINIISNKNVTRYIDNKPLLGQWSLYKTCTLTTNGRTFCTKPHKIYLSIGNRRLNTYINNKSSSNNTNYSSNRGITYSAHNYKKNYPYSASSCSAIEQPAKNLSTGECRVYSNPCDVPVGWKNVVTCNIKNNELSFAMKRRLKTIITRFVDKVVKKNIEDYKKLDIIKKSITRFKSVRTINGTRLSYISTYSIRILENQYNRYKRDYSLDTGIYYQFNEFLDGSY